MIRDRRAWEEGSQSNSGPLLSSIFDPQSQLDCTPWAPGTATYCKVPGAWLSDLRRKQRRPQVEQVEQVGQVEQVEGHGSVQ